MTHHDTPSAVASRAQEPDLAAAPPQRAGLRARLAARPWYRRIEYAMLIFTVGLMAAFAFAFFYFDVDTGKLNRWGYGGLFLVSLVSAASIIMPMPGVAAITGAGALLDPVLGIPVPVLVALVAGPAEAIGEITGYTAGYGGSVFVEDRPQYPKVKRWMERRGIQTMFVLSAFPNPLVDVAGLAAGAVRMRLWRFYAGVLPGKMVKNVYLAAGGLAAGELIRKLAG